jgi:hypothetical protein
VTRQLQAACAVLCVVAGLVVQFLTRVAALEDVGLAAILVGLTALAMIVPALFTEPARRGGEYATGPPPPTPQ